MEGNSAGFTSSGKVLNEGRLMTEKENETPPPKKQNKNKNKKQQKTNKTLPDFSSLGKRSRWFPD